MKSFEFLISAQFLLQSETRWSLNGSEPLINQSLNKIPEGKRAKLSIWEKQKLLTHKTQDDLKKVTSPTRFWLNGFRFQVVLCVCVCLVKTSNKMFNDKKGKNQLP